MGYAAIVAVVAMFLAFLFIERLPPAPDYNVTTVAKTFQPLK